MLSQECLSYIRHVDGGHCPALSVPPATGFRARQCTAVLRICHRSIEPPCQLSAFTDSGSCSRCTARRALQRPPGQKGDSMWFDSYLSNRVRHGTLILEFADGTESRRYGEGDPVAVWQVESPRVLRKISADPGFMLGQTYMDGAWSVPPDGLLPLLEVLMRNFHYETADWKGRLWRALLAPLQQWNRARASRRNVSHHYDLDADMFRQFLDEDMQYSCAYFLRPDISLEEAQRAKCEHIRRK